jgi:hypothetical protein
MSRYEKSDAQLDAEAEARRRGLGPPKHDHGFDDPNAYDVPAFASSSKPEPAPDPVGLARLVEFHRTLRRDELRIDRMVARQPPSSRDPSTGVVHQHEAAAIGMNMSARLYRFVESAPPMEFPWHAALSSLRVECRRKHPQHRSSDRPYWRGALCHQAVKLVVVGGEANGIGPLTPLQAGGVSSWIMSTPC